MRIHIATLLVYVVAGLSHQVIAQKVTCKESQETILTHLLVPAGPVPTAFDPNGVYPSSAGIKCLSLNYLY